ncbi:MAG: hypothetical protein IPN00_11315 [Hydrogenophilales bacterium]|nr:hypothetical protein [Hydrogenophilales bacterium]
MNKQTMSIGPLAEDERLKMVLLDCLLTDVVAENFSVDGRLPTKRDGLPLEICGDGVGPASNAVMH